MPGKRQRDPLSPLAHEIRDRSMNGPQDWHLVTKGRSNSVTIHRSNSEKAKKAVRTRNQVTIELDDEEQST